MPGLDVKSMDAPDETRPFADKGQAEVVTVDGETVLRGTYEPGWRWSEHVKPIAQTESCQSHHFFYTVSGRMHVEMNDGTEREIGPGDVVRIEPGHDAWVVGDEACITVDFGASASYAKRQ